VPDFHNCEPRSTVFAASFYLLSCLRCFWPNNVLACFTVYCFDASCSSVEPWGDLTIGKYWSTNSFRHITAVTVINKHCAVCPYCGVWITEHSTVRMIVYEVLACFWLRRVKERPYDFKNIHLVYMLHFAIGLFLVTLYKLVQFV